MEKMTDQAREKKKRPEKGKEQTLPVGRILSYSRRAVTLLAESGEILSGRLASKAIEATVGDMVGYSVERNEVFVRTLLEARNTITRSYFDETRRIAANVDHLFIGSAVEPLFNTSFIDRLLVEATLQEIPCTLLVNKIDLGVKATERLIAVYEKLGVDILLTSAIRGDGMNALRERLEDPALQVVVIGGISGVGKSTLVNSLLPEAKSRTAEVSERTGQGKQTTAQAMGYLFQRNKGGRLVIVDLPGIQRFGVSHLTPELIRMAFPEFVENQNECEYDSCTHTKEEKCAVKAGLESGKIAHSRYESYLGMLDEILASRKY